MAPIGLLSHGQNVINDIKNQQLVEAYLAKHGHLGRHTTNLPAINVQDDAELDFESNISNESSQVSLDQSNNGFSLINLHWASFSMKLSSVPAVVLAGLFIAGCCYFRGRRQC